MRGLKKKIYMDMRLKKVNVYFGILNCIFPSDLMCKASVWAYIYEKYFFTSYCNNEVQLIHTHRARCFGNEQSSENDTHTT